MKLCTFEGCDGKLKARGLCKKHYNRLMRGTLDNPRYSAPRPGVGERTKYPFEFVKRGKVWYRRPVGSDDQWELVPGFVGVAA